MSSGTSQTRAARATRLYVFIVGLPRTGTKLLKNVLENSRRHECSITPENFFLGRFLRPGVRDAMQKLGPLTDDANVHRLMDLMYSGNLWGEYWSRLRRGTINVDREALTAAILRSDRSDRAIYAALLEAHVDLKPDTILGDKTGPHLYRVPTLIEWFPEARVIQAFRDPRAIIASEHKKQRAKVSRERDRAREEGRRLRALKLSLMEPLIGVRSVVYITAAWIWAARLDRKYAARYPQNYRVSRYEDLVSKPEESVRSLCDFLGIEFEEDMLAPQRVDSSFSRGPGGAGFDTAALDRWKDYLKPWMKLFVHVLARKHLKAFGYLPQSGGRGKDA